ncbi:MAG: 2-(1,2-epoxy-1,2-dihydrophenyl)acetyl-CoA isomerase [Gracilimonas sp.]|uniref:enoyl-CoA hydratase-related protein n=1 Tax=Gracilimonas TaxID=649462 RepID=UPI001B0ADACE|nr:enoyl-CoA hydratase-related protein [Gracilimonas sp.]MBO6585380.1 2-(1,2-epoxy-1,2-dihydrophenyl)acetyl-CoA isomerase [Gracilimonas sp.]MBO6616376.1 2-(1,2-epoxy-1,2-dihydrophenyl)acetyl-CoA isomerase [Gracilimonas sp.]
MIQTTLSNGIFTITLNRPDKLNSFIFEMANQLKEALHRAESDDEVRCVLLTGEGRAFCAGQDLAEATEVSNDPDRDLSEIVHHTYIPIIKGIRKLEKPVVCAVNGTAAGAGANIALACDIVIASEEASFIQSFSQIGLIPDSGGTYILPRLIGLARATALTFLGEKVSAAEAVEMGMIWKAYPTGKYMDEAKAIASKLANMPTKGFGLTKRGFNAGFSNSLEEQMKLEAKLQAEAGKTHDYNEGVKAFMEKRKPEFKGQ